MTDAAKPVEAPALNLSPSAPRVLKWGQGRLSQGGRLSVQEAWTAGLPPKARCTGCRTKRGIVAWIRVYYPQADFLRVYGPQQALLHALKHGGKLPILDTIYGPFVWLGNDVFACSRCAPAEEQAAAQHPSWALAEIRRPPATQLRVAVPR